MKRRNFLKTIAGIVGAAVAGAKIKPASIATPVPAPALPSVQWIADEACDSDRIYLIPRGLKYLVNNESKLLQWEPLPVSYPDLTARRTHNTLAGLEADLEKVAKKLGSIKL